MSSFKKLFFIAIFSLSAAYSATDKTINISVNTIGFTVGATDFNVDYYFTSKHDQTLGLEYSWTDYEKSGTTADGYAYGLRYNYFFGGTPIDSSWVAGAAFGFFHFDYSSNSLIDPTVGLTRTTVFTSSNTSYYYRLHAGYQWMWDSFNVTTTAGITYYDEDDSITSVDTDGNNLPMQLPLSGVEPYLALNLGWAF